MFNKCTDCGNSTIVETNHEYVCNNCGLVLIDRLFTDEPEWRQYASELPFAETSNSRVDMIDNAQTFKDIEVRNIVECIQSKLHLPEHICTNGGQLYEEFKNKCSSNKKWCLVSAFVFYAQRDLVTGARTKDEFINAIGLIASQFNKTLTMVKEVLFQQKETQRLVTHRENVSDTLHRLVVMVKSIPENRIQDVKRTVNKLYAKIDRSAEPFSSIQVDKLNAAIIYMACRYLKMRITVKEVAESCSTSMATIIKVETLVKERLSTM